MTLPFYFKWVDPNTAFDAGTMNVFEEDVFSFKINHEEGQVPTLELVLRNPRIGLLNPSRKRDAWLAWQSPADHPVYAGAIVPLFYGRLVGIPSNMFKELVTLQFIARAHNFIAAKQAVAETMRVRPYYDPFFLDDAHRDDPDSILEGWSALWHTDRLTREITASDVLVGEDGTVTFDEDNAFYDSVGMSVGEPPLNTVRVEASVNWSQRTAGFFTVPPVSMASYTGDSFLGDWPKAGGGLGGGYTVQSSFVTDVFHVAQTPQTNFSSSWTNTDPNPGQCSNASASSQSSGPALLSPNPLSCILTIYEKSGLCFPDSDPPQNIPAEVSVTGMIVPCWFMRGDMTVRYDAGRSYSELLAFNMNANVQQVLSDPTVDQYSELITIESIDIGKPMFDVKKYTDFLDDKSVSIAQIIWPNDPSQPGGLAYQICVTPGNTGTSEPTFSDIPGETTNDGTVVWACIGSSISDNPEWNAGMGVPVGMMVLIVNQEFNPATGNLETVPNTGSYYLAVKAGITNDIYDTFTYVPPVSDNNSATPAPRTVSIVNAPEYSETPGTLIDDGSVQWMVLGPTPPGMTIPIGGTTTNVQANNYFPTARGQWSVEYLIMKARARLRFRSRAMELEWDTFFDNCVGLSLRKNATLFDPRIPGGAATGKIIAYSMECEGGTGHLRGHVKIGVAVGFGASVAEVDGVGEYAAEGYAQKGWQVYDGKKVDPGTADILYTPPVYAAFDDGLRFPLTWSQISDGGRFSNTLDAQKAAIEESFKTAQELSYIQQWAGKTLSSSSNPSASQSGISSEEAWKIEEQQLALASSNTPYVMEANPIVWTALIKPCSGNGPFTGSYAITVSDLEVPEGVNLAAASSP